MNRIVGFLFGRILRKLDRLSDAEIEAIARRIDDRIDLPWLTDTRESAVIRGGVRAAIALVRELIAELDRRGF